MACCDSGARCGYPAWKSL